MDATYFIEKLELLTHPEGGFYKEVYRDNELIKREALAIGFQGDRNASTAIYYLLEKGNFSCFHRIKSDEVWHHYDGGTTLIYYFQHGRLHTLKLGKNIEKGEFPVCIVPKNTWFAAELAPETEFALMGCTVAPGFDFADFEKASLEDLSDYLTLYKDIVSRLTH